MKVLALVPLVALACALPRAPEPPPAAGVTTVPIRDRYARARIEMVDAVNADRARHGRPPIVLDSLASVVAQDHAEEMSAGGWLSHYNAAGLAPYERFAAAGGTGHVLENVFRSQQRARVAWAVDDLWELFDIRDAEAWLMSSEGHRKAILDPHRARIGVGIAVDPGRGAVYVVQELVTAAATIEHPSRVLPGQEASVSGQVGAPGTRPLMLVLARAGRAAVGRARRTAAGWRVRGRRIADPSDPALGDPLEPRRSLVRVAAPDGARRGARPLVRRALRGPRRGGAGSAFASPRRHRRGWPAAAFVVEVL